MIKINLIPVEQRKSIEGMGQFLFGMFILVLVIAFMVALTIIQNNKIQYVKDETARVEKRIKELDAIRKKVEDFKQKNQELEKRIQVIAQLEKNRVGPLYVMDALSDVIPEKLWIDNFINKGNSATFNGIAANEFVIADFMRNLDKNEHFTYANVGTIKNQTVSGKPFKSFSMNVGLQFGQVEPEESNNQQKSGNKTNTTTENIKNLNDTGQVESKNAPNSENMEDMNNSGHKSEMNDNKSDNGAKDKKIERKEEKKQASPSEKVGTDDGSNVIVF